MDKFYFEIPSMERKDDIIDYLDEFVEYKSDINGSGSLDKIYEGYTFSEALERCLRLKDPEYAKSIDRATGETLMFVREEDNKIVGMLNLRWNLPERMLEFGGHIGYGIRPTERQKGYNKIQLYMGLIEADKEGLSEVHISCDRDNPGSDKSIKALGGELIKSAIDPEDGIFTNVYKIDVKKSIETYKDLYAKYIK